MGSRPSNSWTHRRDAGIAVGLVADLEVIERCVDRRAGGAPADVGRSSSEAPRLQGGTLNLPAAPSSSSLVGSIETQEGHVFSPRDGFASPSRSGARQQWRGPAAGMQDDADGHGYAPLAWREPRPLPSAAKCSARRSKASSSTTFSTTRQRARRFHPAGGWATATQSRTAAASSPWSGSPSSAGADRRGGWLRRTSRRR